MNKAALLSLGLISGLIASNAQASTVYAKNNAFETQVCVAAAQGGLSAAKAFAQSEGQALNVFRTDIRCNGKSLRAFARDFVSATETTKVEVFAADAKIASELCVKAAKRGVDSLNVNRVVLRELKCNGMNVTDFARKFAPNAQ